MLGGDRSGSLDPEAEEICDPVGVEGPVDLVHGDGDRLGSPSKGPSDRLVVGQAARLRIDHKEDGIRLIHRRLGLGLNGGRQTGFGFGIESGGIHDEDPATTDFYGFDDAVAGDTRCVFHQGASPAGVPVEKARLPNVRPAHNGDDGGMRCGHSRRR